LKKEKKRPAKGRREAGRGGIPPQTPLPPRPEKSENS